MNGTFGDDNALKHAAFPDARLDRFVLWSFVVPRSRMEGFDSGDVHRKNVILRNVRSFSSVVSAFFPIRPLSIFLFQSFIFLPCCC